MKKFFKDYGELCKQSGKFYKDHWLGTIIMSVASGAITLAVMAGPEIKEKIEDKVHSIKHKDE